MTLDPGTYKDRMHTAINNERTSRGLGRVPRGNHLDASAQDWADHIKAILTLTHCCPDSETRMRAHGWSGTNSGECVGNGDLTPEQMIDLYMNSTEHRAIILDPVYTNSGMGATLGAKGKWWTCLDFGD